MKPRIASTLLVAVMLCGGALAVAKPALLTLGGNKSGGSLAPDWGIPVKWYASPQDTRSECVEISEDSIGLDFLNVERCIRSFGIGKEIYAYDCPCDPFRRPYTYPPLLTFLFGWTAWMPVASALAIWCLSVLALIAVNGSLWIRRWSEYGERFGCRKAAAWSCWFVFSYPGLFSFERGNHDVWVLTFLTLAGYLWIRRRWFGLGAILAATGLLKIYPMPLAVTVCAVPVVLIVSAGGWREAARVIFRCALGGLAASFALLAVFWESSLHYFSRTLPMLAGLKLTVPENVHSHSLPAAFGSAGLGLFAVFWLWAALLLAVALLEWHRRSDRESERRALRCFAFLIGLSVYLPNTSYDYNLILWIPFFASFLIPAKQNENRVEIFGLVLLASGCFLPRWLQSEFWSESPVSIYLALQAAGISVWLLGSSRFPRRVAGAGA